MAMMILLFVFVLSGCVLSALSLPLIRRAIAPNPLYGFRVKRTLENPNVWYAVNEYAGRRLLVVGVSTILSAVVLFWVTGISVDQYATAVAVVNLGGLAVALLQSVRFL